MTDKRASDTTDFSRVVFQFQPKSAAGLVISLDTTDFSRVVFHFRPFFEAETEPSTRLKVGGM
jgi:hypothetical protein